MNLFLGATTAAMAVSTLLATPAIAVPHSDPPASSEQRPQPQPAELQDEDLRRDLSQPDFAVITLPTTLRVPKGKLTFRLTHRFSRPLGEGDLGHLLEDFLGLDSAAQIGLEFRYGLRSGTQIGIHRTNEKTIQLFAQQDLLPRNPERLFGAHLLATFEGLDNFRERRSSGASLVLSRKLGERGAVYVEPIWLSNTNLLSDAGDDQTFLLGLAARLRLRPTVYLLGQFTPRLTGYDPGEHHGAFAIEKRAGGHTFQLNFSNSLASTPRQVAQGASAIVNNWHIGFNISRKFY